MTMPQLSLEEEEEVAVEAEVAEEVPEVVLLKEEDREAINP